MVVQADLSDAEVDRLFHALADATRRDIVRRTLVGDESVTALAAEYSMSFAAVSKHVAVLEEAGLVTRRPDGRRRLVRADPERLAQAQRLLDAFEQVWRHRIDALDAVLSTPTDTP